jgi:hypothetical protein
VRRRLGNWTLRRQTAGAGNAIAFDVTTATFSAG